MKRYFFFLFIAGILFGCDSDTVSITDQGVADPFMPGNYWIYSRADTLDTLTVSSHGNAIMDEDRTLYSIDKVGFWDDCYLVISFNPQAGDTLGKSGHLSLKVGSKVAPGKLLSIVGALHIPVTVPGGTFITNRFHWRGVTEDGTIAFDIITYFNSSIGIIKQETWIADDSGVLQLTSTRELLRYKIR